MFASRLVPISALTPAFQGAAKAAVDAQKHSYAPYSKFMVGACLVHKDDSLTIGANYENAIFQSTCAERTAIVSANVKGHRLSRAIAIYGRPADPEAKLPADSLCPPCGLCRQFLVEVAQLSGVADFDIILVTFDTQKAVVVKLSELLPCQFGPADLNLNIGQWSVDCCDGKTA